MKTLDQYFSDKWFGAACFWWAIDGRLLHFNIWIIKRRHALNDSAHEEQCILIHGKSSMSHPMVLAPAGLEGQPTLIQTERR